MVFLRCEQPVLNFALDTRYKLGSPDFPVGRSQRLSPETGESTTISVLSYKTASHTAR